MRSSVIGSRPMLTISSRAGSRPVVSTSIATIGTSASGVSPATAPAA